MCLEFHPCSHPNYGNIDKMHTNRKCKLFMIPLQTKEKTKWMRKRNHCTFGNLWENLENFLLHLHHLRIGFDGHPKQQKRPRAKLDDLEKQFAEYCSPTWGQMPLTEQDRHTVCTWKFWTRMFSLLIWCSNFLDAWCCQRGISWNHFCPKSHLKLMHQI